MGANVIEFFTRFFPHAVDICVLCQRKGKGFCACERVRDVSTSFANMTETRGVLQNPIKLSHHGSVSGLTVSCVHVELLKLRLSEHRLEKCLLILSSLVSIPVVFE